MEEKDKLEGLAATLRKAIDQGQEGDITVFVAAMDNDHHTYGVNGTKKSIAKLLLMICDDEEYGELFADTILGVAKFILAKRRIEKEGFIKGKAEA